MAKRKTSTLYVQQRRRIFRNIERLDDSPAVVGRRAQHHHDLLKRNIVDGCCSATSIFDDECSSVIPSIFDQRVQPLELADELLRSGSTKDAQKAASGEISQTVDS